MAWFSSECHGLKYWGSASSNTACIFVCLSVRQPFCLYWNGQSAHYTYARTYLTQIEFENLDSVSKTLLSFFKIVSYIPSQCNFYDLDYYHRNTCWHLASIIYIILFLHPYTPAHSFVLSVCMCVRVPSIQGAKYIKQLAAWLLHVSELSLSLSHLRSTL